MSNKLDASPNSIIGRDWLARMSIVAMLFVLSAIVLAIGWRLDGQGMTSWNVPLFVIGCLLFLYTPGRLFLRLFG